MFKAPYRKDRGFCALGWVGGVSRALQKPLRLDHSHASMAAALALHGFAGAATEHPQWGERKTRLEGWHEIASLRSQ